MGRTCKGTCGPRDLRSCRTPRTPAVRVSTAACWNGVREGRSLRNLHRRGGPCMLTATHDQITNAS
jgi:hypothetical protein